MIRELIRQGPPTVVSTDFDRRTGFAQPSRRWPRYPWPLAFVLLLAEPAPVARAGVLADSPHHQGALGMPEPQGGPLLVAYYKAYLRDQDVDAFRSQVSSRYLEGSLARLVGAADLRTRRAAVFALGLVGSLESNATVARALRDRDPALRGLAENALWAIWFRADTPENNDALEQVSQLIGQHAYGQAVKSASRLIEQAPYFAEAYNQRAIAEYHLGEFPSSARDCRLVLERNPYHIGALAGLAKCLLRLDRRDEALDTLRRSSHLQPFNDDLRHLIAVLEDDRR